MNNVMARRTVSDIIQKDYRGYWNYTNGRGKNSVDPKEGVPEVVRRIVFSCFELGVKPYEETKTVSIQGKVVTYHPHGDSSIQDSIKGVGTPWKSQPAAWLLQGVGNFGMAQGDAGAASRYTSVAGTPLLSLTYKDIPYMHQNDEETGLPQPDYISFPLPMHLVNGFSPIGTGRSCYIAERNAREVIEWIDQLRVVDFDPERAESRGIIVPSPMSVTGCKTWYEPSNGYIYYRAMIHEGVQEDDITKKGRFDVITALPPNATPDAVISKLTDKLPANMKKRIKDGSGKGKPTWIVIPHGALEESDYNRMGLQSARKENIYIWDDGLNTMRSATVYDLAKGWFEDRCRVVTLRLKDEIRQEENQVHKIDLIKLFAENKMQNWKSERIIKFYTDLDKENGEEDAKTVLRMSVSAFLPENLQKNELTKEKCLKHLEELKSEVEHIGDFVIEESLDIIDKQEEFYREIQSEKGLA